MKLKELKDKISGTAIAAVIAIVALLIITVDQKNDKDVLRAELANAEVGISGVEAGYLDSIAHFEGTIQDYELEIAEITDVLKASEDDLAAINGRLQVSDNDRVTAEVVAAELAEQLFTVKAALVELQENPNCPVTQ